MATKIRLKRMGKKFYAFYRVVIMDSRTKRDGRAIEEIGTYNPNTQPSTININSERAQYWLGVGAQPTEQVLNLLNSMKKSRGLTYLFIAHDLSVVRFISDRIAVISKGRIVELAEAEELFLHPLHPYTKALFSAIPVPDPTVKMDRIVLEGSIPSPANPPAGCKFHTRCPYATERCKTEAPQQREVEPGHYVVCHLYEK